MRPKHKDPMEKRAVINVNSMPALDEDKQLMHKCPGPSSGNACGKARKGNVTKHHVNVLQIKKL